MKFRLVVCMVSAFYPVATAERSLSHTVEAHFSKGPDGLLTQIIDNRKTMQVKYNRGVAIKLMRESMGQQVRKVLVDRIMSGKLAPGERLMELHIAAELQTSQAPVREAFRELEALGLIVTEPYKGSRVREVTKQDTRDAYIVRASLEGLAGRLAAQHLESETKKLEKLAKDIQDAAKRKNIGDYVRHDIAFHRSIVEASQNKVLLRSWDALGFEVRMQVRLQTWSLDLLTVQQEHFPIIDALASGNGELAGKLLQAHVSGLAA